MTGEGPALGEVLPVWSVMPFVLLLLAIAVIPLRWGHFWQRNRNKALVSLVLGLPVAAWVAVHDPSVLLHTAVEYVGFIALLAALYIIAGGIVLRGDLRATPAV